MWTAVTRHIPHRASGIQSPRRWSLASRNEDRCRWRYPVPRSVHDLRARRILHAAAIHPHSGRECPNIGSVQSDCDRRGRRACVDHGAARRIALDCRVGAVVAGGLRITARSLPRRYRFRLVRDPGWWSRPRHRSPPLPAGRGLGRSWAFRSRHVHWRCLDPGGFMAVRGRREEADCRGSASGACRLWWLGACRVGLAICRRSGQYVSLGHGRLSGLQCGGASGAVPRECAAAERSGAHFFECAHRRRP